MAGMPQESARPTAQALALNWYSIRAALALVVMAFFLLTVTQHNESVFGFLVNFIILWMGPPLAWMFAAGPMAGLSGLLAGLDDPEHSGPLSLKETLVALGLPLAGIALAGAAMGYYMEGLWAHDGIGPPVMACATTLLFGVVFAVGRPVRAVGLVSILAAALLAAAYGVGGVLAR